MKQELSGYTVYAFLQKLGDSKGRVILGAPKPSKQTSVSMLGHMGNFPWESTAEGMAITIPAINENDLPCRWAWVLKMTDLTNWNNDGGSLVSI
jgi:alpha-L-fucosidase